jgi:hypothetical protein
MLGYSIVPRRGFKARIARNLPAPAGVPRVDAAVDAAVGATAGAGCRAKVFARIGAFKAVSSTPRTRSAALGWRVDAVRAPELAALLTSWSRERHYRSDRRRCH